jgi:hypothetical protein
VTLILGFKAAHGIVIAADSLTSVTGRTVSCTTRKVHKVGTTAIAAGAGKSTIMGKYWSEILPEFSPSSKDLDTMVHELRQFFDAVIGEVPKNSIGGCRGGNTFILAGATLSGDAAVYLLERIGDRRTFESTKLICSGREERFLKWAGDTSDRIAAHMKDVENAYEPSMTCEEAIAFATDAIIGAIHADRAGGGTSIGGDFVLIGTVFGDAVDLLERPTGIPCEVSSASNPPANLCTR